MEASVLISIIISTSGVFVAVAANIVVWIVKITKIEQDVSNLRNEFDQHRQETKEDVRNLNTKIDTVASDLNTKIETVASDLNTKIDNLSAKIETLVSTVYFMQGILQGKFGVAESDDSVKSAKTFPSVVNDKKQGGE